MLTVHEAADYLRLSERTLDICIAYDFYKLRHHLPDGVRFSRLYYNEDAPQVGL